MLSLRPAVPDDESRLLNWRNETSTRQASFRQEEISVQEHRVWFARKLADPASVLLIVEEAGRPIGQVRLDRIEPSIAEISIGLATDARGRGLGREALRLALRQARPLLGVESVRALVKRDNDTSLVAFRAAGFEIARFDGDSVELLSRVDVDPAAK